jgi:hypothetical protein
MNLQQRYDLECAKDALGASLRKIRRHPSSKAA